MGTPADELFPLGVVTGTHGLRGDLKVRPLTAEASALLDPPQLWLRDRDGRVSSCRPVRVTPHKGGLLLRLEGFDDVNAARHLVGCEVLMRFADLPQLPEDEFYWFELEGMTVADRTRGELGTLTEVFTTAAHDVYVVRGRFGEVLVPAVAEFVLAVDREGRRMEVDLPEGLVPETDEV